MERMFLVGNLDRTQNDCVHRWTRYVVQPEAEDHHPCLLEQQREDTLMAVEHHSFEYQP